VFVSSRLRQLLLALALAAVPAGTAHAQAAPCQLVLGFKSLHDLAAADVGDCTENQSSLPNGDAQQHTTKGLMIWRKADNWTAFTDGYKTWINGPDGLAIRLNTDRFPWEAATPAPASTPAPAPAAASTSSPAPASAPSPAPAPAPSPAPAPASTSLASSPPDTGWQVNPNGPCVKQVGAQVKHEAGPFYRIEVQALDAAGAPVAGAFGSYTANYGPGFWPLFDVTDSTGYGWNAWQVVGAKSPVNVTVTVSSGGCVATTTTSFQLA
jgi:pyruvate/2-oxoglutarate dehydrogenase complex dihydrolipoamide acyltransferase (E2) component